MDKNEDQPESDFEKFDPKAGPPETPRATEYAWRYDLNLEIEAFVSEGCGQFQD